MLEDKREAEMDKLMAIGFEWLSSRQEAPFLAVQQERPDLMEKEEADEEEEEEE